MDVRKEIIQQKQIIIDKIVGGSNKLVGVSSSSFLSSSPPPFSSTESYNDDSRQKNITNNVSHSTPHSTPLRKYKIAENRFNSPLPLLSDEMQKKRNFSKEARTVEMSSTYIGDSSYNDNDFIDNHSSDNNNYKYDNNNSNYNDNNNDNNNNNNNNNNNDNNNNNNKDKMEIIDYTEENVMKKKKTENCKVCDFLPKPIVLYYCSVLISGLPGVLYVTQKLLCFSSLTTKECYLLESLDRIKIIEKNEKGERDKGRENGIGGSYIDRDNKCFSSSSLLSPSSFSSSSSSSSSSLFSSFAQSVLSLPSSHMRCPLQLLLFNGKKELIIIPLLIDSVQLQSVILETKRTFCNNTRKQ